MTQTFIIHLATSTARQPQVDALCAALPGAQVVDAVDGRLMSAAERGAYYQPNLNQPAYPFALLPGEIGCFLSHRKCWQAIIAGDAPYGLIIEDDVALDMAHFGPALALAQAHCAPDMYIRLPLVGREKPAQVLGTAGQAQLFQPVQVGLATSVQLVGRTAAKQLLNLTAQFDRPIDTFLQMNWLTGLSVATVYPNGARSVADKQGGSTIQKKKSWAEKLPREFKRARYRARIRALAAKHLAQNGHTT